MSPVVDWGVFAGEDGGHRFERFCADLLLAQGYAVEHMAKGGNDEGKDILILQRAKDLGDVPPTALCLVECKSRTSRDRKAISLEDINRSLWALFENNCACLVVFTTHKFNSQAVNCFLRVNERGRMKISWIDQDDLLEFGRRYPGVWRRHLGADPPEASAPPSRPHEVRVYGQARRFFWADDDPLGVVVHNCGSSAGRATLRKHGVMIEEFVLDHHQRTILHAPQPDEVATDPYEGLTVTFESSDAAQGTEEHDVRGGAHLESRRRIDHLFADPGKLRERVLDSLAGGRAVHLRGTAGSGKSRLLAECRKRLPGAVFADLSRDDEEECLLDLLVQQATGWPVQLLASVPETLVGGLSISAECDGGAVQLVAEYCAGRKAHSAAAVAQALVALASKTVKTLIVDNIQDGTELDEAILQAALAADAGFGCLLSTRTERLSLPSKAERITRAAPRKVVEMELDSALPARLSAFIELAAIDRDAAEYLLMLVREGSFQSGVSKLKALRQLGAVEVDQNGRIRLVAAPPPINLGGYAKLQEVILYSRLPDALRAPCTGALQAASIFGETFPVSFIESLFGENGVDALDELERRELIRAVPEASPYGLCFRFDHELTRAAVAGAIATTKRTRLHLAAARFIETWPDFQPGSGNYEAAGHYQAGGRPADALAGYEFGAHHYLRVGRVGNAQVGLLAALPLFDELPIERSLDSVARELDLREQLLETALLVALPEEQWRRQIDAFQIQSHLFPGIPDLARRIGRGHCFNACFDGHRRRVPSAWREMEKAITLLETIDDPLPLAEALKWGANVQKNLGAYDTAAAMALRAYELYISRQQEFRAGETATELSHVHYEAFQFEDAMRWGETALSHYAAFGHPGLVARARIDIARMLAMLCPGERRTQEELEFAVTLARHAGIGSHVAKAIMNLGIHLTIEICDERQAAGRFSDAQQVLRAHPNAYVETLLRFALTGLRCQRDVAQAMRASPVGEQLIAWCSHFEAPEQIGDRRMQMMLKMLGAAGNPSVTSWLANFPSSRFAAYAGIGLGKRFAALEHGSPLLRRGGLALYY